MRRLLLLLATIALLFPSCGGGDSPATAPATKQPSPDSATEQPERPEKDLGEANLAPCPKGPKSKTQLRLTTVDWAFRPETLKAPAGEMVTLILSNEGTDPHQFSSLELGCESPLLAGGEKTSVTFEMPQEPLPFYCRPHWYVMKGEIALK